MKMDPENWERSKELFQAALEMDASQRASFLAENCHDDDLRQQVENLLISYEEAGNFLDDPFLSSGIVRGPNAVPETQAEESRLPPESVALLTTASKVEAKDPMVGRQLGAYKIVRRIGQGGMAAVFLARRADDEYTKEVAIKLVQPGLDSREQLSRFRNERQTLAGLDHPNIVKLLDGGSTTDGLPFLVMDYVDGCPIDDYCDRHKLRVDERLHLFCKVSEAVQFAHQKSVVHRDLKPSNILVTSDGTPRLLDFGIAKVLNPQPADPSLMLTQTGTRCMTPAYASPEQMRGKPITAATDVYSLGVVLYELLSGHRPYRLTQHTPAEIERAICDQDPETPSKAVRLVESDTSSDGTPITKTPVLVSETREGQPDKLQRRLRGDLDNIVLKALQKEPERRYGSVEELSLDIERHLGHLPIKARRSTLAYRTSKFIQRHKTEVGAAFIVLGVVAAAALFSFDVLGVRDRVLGRFSRTQIESLNTTRSFNSRGFVTPSTGGVKPATSCESLTDLKLPETSFSSAQLVSSGRFTPAGADPIQSLPPFCRVEGAIKPTADSDIRFELWLPTSGWNRKFRAVGNVGFGGEINYDDMASSIRAGYATVSTDTGHRSEEIDSLWALGHPEKVADFGYRAIHEMTTKAKATIRVFYGQDPQISFFEGCSNGGRQALMEAQRFPEDYQGILAGAPAINTTRLLAAALYNLSTSSSGHIPPSKIPTISAAVLAACDALDGVSDGILNDPRQCHFNPATLLCHGAETERCLTSAQVAQLRKIYTGLQGPRGEQLYPGSLPGGEDAESGEQDSGWAGWLTGQAAGQGLMAIFALSYYRNMVFEDPAWDHRTVSAPEAVEIADAKTARIVDAVNPDLRRFKARGGKLILYHGWSDAALSGLATTNYYDKIVANMGLQQTESFVRLYMAPGMQHCYGGPGPNFFGQFDPPTTGPISKPVSIAMDPQHNISTALVQWTEKGRAPDEIFATKYINDLDPTQGIKMTRPLCPYPQVAKYKGSGNTNEAANFVCAAHPN